MPRARTRTGPEIRVLCVDDHALLIEGLKAQFSLDPSIRCVGSLDSAANLIDEVARLDPDVVLLDIEMPGPDAFEAADRLRHLHPEVRVIVLSAHVRSSYIAAAFKCGIWGYFAKSDKLESIVAGIREVARSETGTFHLGPKVKARCGPVEASSPRRSAPRSSRRSGKTAPVAPPATRLDSLSAREVEVLRLIGKGQSRTEIAAELCRSAKTIDGHQERIRRKLGVKSRSELMRLAIREGLAQA